MENIEEKQLYLRNNILEKGYNGEQFMEYLKGKKGENEIDLNNWDFNDLKNVVEEFISKHQINTQENINISNAPLNKKWDKTNIKINELKLINEKDNNEIKINDGKINIKLNNEFENN